VLKIGDLGEANLEASIRSFFRTVTGVQNANMQDPDAEKKRKRPTVISNSRLSVLENAVADQSPPKKLRNKDGYTQEPNEVTKDSLPKSIESLYESILSAQKELEAGRNWNADAITSDT
jgi:hypothetical protein